MKLVLKNLRKLDKKEEKTHNLFHEIEGAKDGPCGCYCNCPPGDSESGTEAEIYSGVWASINLE